MSDPVASLADFVAAVRAHPMGVVATTDPSGAPEAALLGLAAAPDGDLVFNAPTSARKIANLGREPRVAVVIGTTGDVSIQVEGLAAVQTGAALVAAAAVHEDRFPGSRATAEGFCVVRVRPTWLRHYDAGTVPARVVEGRPTWASRTA